MPSKDRKEKSSETRKSQGLVYTPSEENQQVTAYMIALRNCPEVDWDNPDDIERAVNRYIAIAHEYGFKPSQTSFAVSVHMTRQAINHVREGKNHRNLRSMRILKEFQTLCEASTREGLTLAKNPSGYIFELKALYGWSDAPAYQIENREDLNENTSIKALASKYLESIVVDDHELVKVKAQPIEEVESTAVIVEDNNERKQE